MCAVAGTGTGVGTGTGEVEVDGEALPGGIVALPLESWAFLALDNV